MNLKLVTPGPFGDFFALTTTTVLLFQSHEEANVCLTALAYDISVVAMAY